MDKIVENLLKDKSPQEISNLLVNINKRVLNRKAHIKKYNKLRNLHSEIIDSMDEYVGKGNYSINEQISPALEDIFKETNRMDINLDAGNIDDKNILIELFVYKNHYKIPSITEVYLEKNKFRNKEKIKMLNSMKNSYVGLFKVIEADRENGYITYEDVFTHKKFKVIDIALSSTLIISKKKTLYSYNRIITYDDISFGTGIHCMMTSDNKELKEFIKKHKYSNCSDFSRCLLLYNLAKRDKSIVITYNNNYGYNR